MGLLMQRHGCRQDQLWPGSITVYNISGFNVRQLSSCMSGIQTFARIISIAEEHYPKNLRKAAVINAPPFFARTLWPAVRGLLKAETAANVCMSSTGCESFKSEQLGFKSEELQELMA